MSGRAAVLAASLAEFAERERFRGKGPLCVALVVTEHARERGLPLDPERLVTERGGQVLGLGKGAVQQILGRHGIVRVLAAEGGRTSRGSLGNMRAYVQFLNRLPPPVELDAAEAFWIGRVHEFFAARPLRIRLDVTAGLQATVADLLRQAAERQRAGQGVKHAGAVLQHLVGAKLECALGSGQVEHHGFAVADAPGGRSGDFLIGDVAIHVTTAPGEGLIGRCRENLDAGLRPVIVTLPAGVAVVAALAANAGLRERIDVFDAEQFVALNVYEIGRFASAGRKQTLADLVDRYNEIVEVHETDPSLQIEVRR